MVGTVSSFQAVGFYDLTGCPRLTIAMNPWLAKGENVFEVAAGAAKPSRGAGVEQSECLLLDRRFELDVLTRDDESTATVGATWVVLRLGTLRDAV